MPHDGREPYAGVAPPDYTDHSAKVWAAFPSRPNGAPFNEARLGGPDGDEGLPADCFFIHPSGFFGRTLVQPHDGTAADRHANERTSLMMAGQASAFNARCRVYAPRYRQQGPKGRADGSFGVAYADVRAAFRHFLSLTGSRPVVIGSHSQGCRLGIKLVAEEVDARPEVAARLVAAYLIGGPVTREYVAGMRRLRSCAGPADTGVIIAWNTLKDVPGVATPGGTYAIDASGAFRGSNRRGDPSLGGLTTAGHPHGFWAGPGNHMYCVSPVTWRAGDQAAPPVGAYKGYVRLDARSTIPKKERERGGPIGLRISGMHPPAFVGELASRVHLGYLHIAPPAEGSPQAGLFPRDVSANTPALRQVLHNNDYSLWYPNVHENVAARVDAFLAGGAAKL